MVTVGSSRREPCARLEYQASLDCDRRDAPRHRAAAISKAAPQAVSPRLAGSGTAMIIIVGAL
jgi:hypothetical protein